MTTTNKNIKYTDKHSGFEMHLHHNMYKNDVLLTYWGS